MRGWRVLVAQTVPPRPPLPVPVPVVVLPPLWGTLPLLEGPVPTQGVSFSLISKGLLPPSVAVWCLLPGTPALTLPVFPPWRPASVGFTVSRRVSFPVVADIVGPLVVPGEWPRKEVVGRLAKRQVVLVGGPVPQVRALRERPGRPLRHVLVVVVRPVRPHGAVGTLRPATVAGDDNTFVAGRVTELVQVLVRRPQVAPTKPP